MAPEARAAREAYLRRISGYKGLEGMSDAELIGMLSRYLRTRPQHLHPVIFDRWEALGEVTAAPSPHTPRLPR